MDRKTTAQAAAVFVVTLVAGLPVALDAGRWLANWPAPRSIPPVPASSGWGTAEDGPEIADRPTEQAVPLRVPAANRSTQPTASPPPAPTVTAPPRPTGPTTPPGDDAGAPTGPPTAVPSVPPNTTGQPQSSAPAVTP